MNHAPLIDHFLKVLYHLDQQQSFDFRMLQVSNYYRLHHHHRHHHHFHKYQTYYYHPSHPQQLQEHQYSRKMAETMYTSSVHWLYSLILNFQILEVPRGTVCLHIFDHLVRHLLGFRLHSGYRSSHSGTPLYVLPGLVLEPLKLKPVDYP